METLNETPRWMDLVYRTFTFGLALATTAFIATSTAVIFTGNTHAVGGAVAHATLAPLRAIFGG
jgi:hypothetical protein